MLKKVLLVLMLLVLALLGYVGAERADTKKLIHTTNEQELDASFYVAQFHHIRNAQSKDKLIKHTQNTLAQLEQAQTVFNQKTLYTPAAKQIRDDYNHGVGTLKDALAALQATDEPDINKTKQQIAKAEQQLLNARERLFDLADRHLMTIQLKM